MPHDDLKPIWKKIDQIYKKLPRAETGTIRGYLKIDIGNEILELKRLFNIWEKDVTNTLNLGDKNELVKLFEQFYSLLPQNSAAKIRGYLNTTASNNFINLRKKVAGYLELALESSHVSSLSRESASAQALTKQGLFANVPLSPTVIKQSTIQELSNIILDVLSLEEKKVRILSFLEKSKVTYPDIFASRDLHGLTPLSVAVNTSDIELVRFLLSDVVGAKEYIKVTNHDGTNVLNNAVMTGEPALIELLLDNWSEIQKTDIEKLAISLQNTPVATIPEVIRIICEKTGVQLEYNNDVDDLERTLVNLTF